MQPTKRKAFTIMEIMTVVVIVGVIAVFAIPNFTTTMEASHEQDAMTQLTTVHAAQEIYRAQNGTYWPPDVTHYTDLTVINNALGISIMANDMNYECWGSNGSTYRCTATRPSGSFMVKVTEAPLSATNPFKTSACTYDSNGVCV